VLLVLQGCNACVFPKMQRKGEKKRSNFKEKNIDRSALALLAAASMAPLGARGRRAVLVRAAGGERELALDATKRLRVCIGSTCLSWYNP